jgi:GNAT superfamily N-acetyltransferase
MQTPDGRDRAPAVNLGKRVMDCVNYCRTETLRNGASVTIRAVRGDDRERFVRAFGLLDRDSIYTRFFGFKSELTPAELDRITSPNSAREVGLVVTVGSGPGETIVASGRYIAHAAPDGARTAEIAFVVEEDYQRLGIAGRLLSHLAGIARDNGIDAFEAEVLASNKPVLAVLARSGLPMRTTEDSGVRHVTLVLGAGPA